MPDERMNEPQRLPREQDLHRGQGIGRKRRGGDVKPRELGGVAKRGVVPEDRNGSGEGRAVVANLADADAEDPADDRGCERPRMLRQLLGAEACSSRSASSSSWT